MSRVFVLEPTKIDIRQARRFGQVVYLFPDESARASFWDDAFKAQLDARLSAVGYIPMQDYLLVAGSVAPLAIAIATLVSTRGPARLLLYHSVERNYRQKIVGDLPHYIITTLEETSHAS